jgi:ubiquinone/menaquinone biosynthesis C-methylase UbiE
MNKNNNLFYAAIPLGVIYFPFAVFFYLFSGKSLTYVSNRLYRLLIVVRHGDWYEERLKKTLKYLNLGKGVKVLEVGCGTGKFSKRLLSCGADLKGIDINKKFIDKLNGMHEGVFELCSVTDLKYGSNSFDRVVLFDVLHHVAEYRKAVSEIMRVLKPGGYAVIWEGSEPLGEDRLPDNVARFLLKVFDGETNPVDFSSLSKKHEIEELEPYCYKITKN